MGYIAEMVLLLAVCLDAHVVEWAVGSLIVL
jgi:hypothetical protein